MPKDFSVEKPLSRAERLMQEALAAQNRNAENSGVEAGSNVASAKGRARAGSRSRDMNRRIREVIREQEGLVYGVARGATADDEQGRTEAATEASSAMKDESKKPSSSWEDIADEIAPAATGPRARRGLATGAMRGGSLPNPDAPRAHPMWREQPAAPRAIMCPLPAPSELLHTALGGEVRSYDRHGDYLLVSRPAIAYDAAFTALKERFQRVLDAEKFAALSGANAGDVLFVDIETAGLSSGQPLFLIGALSMEGEPHLHLFLARDYPEEKAALAAYHELAHGKRLVTFNGKRFDWPYIEGRSISHRLTFKQPRGHFDLLHHARRVWKHSLPNCKLQTLELYLCGRTRVDDVPGYQIPAAYHEFVATHAATGGGAHLMAPILHHNALDILTMAELVCKAGEE